MFVSGSESLGNSVPVYCSGSTSFDVRSWKISLKNFQGLLSIVQLSMFFLLLPFHATAFILYQSVSCLSTTFLNYFLLLFLNLSSSNSDILSYIFLLVNNFFEVFFKRYFQTKRRKRDSNPRAGCPTYTLSRGASSASWVFLLSPIQGLYLTVCLHTFNVTSQRIDNYT